MSFAYSAGIICRKVWNGPFHIGRLSQPVSVGDVMLKLLEVIWRLVVSIIALVVFAGVIGAIWAWQVHPVLYPEARSKLTGEAIYDDGSGQIPLRFRGVDRDGKPFRCSKYYPFMVRFSSSSSRPITEISFQLEGKVPGFSNNVFSPTSSQAGSRILPPKAWGTQCFHYEIPDNIDPRKLKLGVDIWSAEYADE